MLKNHEKWLTGKKGTKANLEEVDLRGVDLTRADLREANLRGADLWRANLWRADLWGANLREANLRGADLWEANLWEANLRGANLWEANLWRANLKEADLTGADLRGADLTGADLTGANLRDIRINYLTVGIHPAPEGDLIGWGKKNGHIVKLLIPKEARRSCATTRKYRAEYAICLEIEGADEVKVENYYATAIYRSGEKVVAHEWCEDRWQECAGGIHFFLTREEAENWVDSKEVNHD
ncbi:pentapeptide repeat-containing protein [bacterium]|nr:pentapeptide repeat-containing protein [bacterium]